jgi:hypothetical protein
MEEEEDLGGAAVLRNEGAVERDGAGGGCCPLQWKKKGIWEERPWEAIGEEPGEGIGRSHTRGVGQRRLGFSPWDVPFYMLW